MDFDYARIEDVESIEHINQTLLRENLQDFKKGFLLGKRSKEEIIQNLKRYYVAKENAVVLGYIEILLEISKFHFALSDWDHEQLKLEVLGHVRDHHFVYINQIAVQDQRKGVGRFLIENILRIYKEFLLISSVAFKPYFNDASKNFHERMLFRKVGVFHYEKKFGFPFYSYFCYIR